MILGRLAVLLLLSAAAIAQNDLAKEANSAYPDAHAFYLDLHQHPELSSHEAQTAAKLADRLRKLGYEVTEQVGGHGVVAILRNAAGPTVMLRTELDALPVEEKTGLPYASKVHAKDASGHEVPVMHACGHDLHMSSLLGAAEIMARTKNTWHGTLLLLGQPAEETISGARAILEDGFLTRFPRPDAGIALHVGNQLPAGHVGVIAGVFSSNADSLRITLYGKGGHGAYPHTTVDPVVLGARTVLALQTIVSREVKPGETAIVTVGYLHAGTKNNVIADEAELGLTVRSFKSEVREQVLAAISRIVNAEAQAAGAPRPPRIERFESTAAVFNDPGLVARLRPVLETALGKDNVETEQPLFGSEDYSFYVDAGIPSFYFSLGGADPAAFAQAKASGAQLPSNHSPLFAPDVDPALHTGIAAEVALLRSLLNTSREDLKKSTTGPAR